MKRISASQVFLAVLFVSPVVVAVIPIIAAASHSAKYDLFHAPIVSWFVFVMSGLILALDVTVIRLWRRSRDQSQKLEQAMEGLAPPGEHLPAVCGHAKLGQPEFPVLVQMLFRRFPGLKYVYVTPLPGGYGGSTTVLAKLEQERAGAVLPQSYVLKLGRKEEMADECDKFDRYVRARLLNVPHFHSQRYVEWGESAGIAYEFAGLGGEIQNFYQFYRGGAVLAAVELVEEILSHLGKAWYQHGEISPASLYHEYHLLSKKRGAIIGHVNRIVDKNDPYRANLVAIAEDLRPNLKPGFCPSSDIPWYDPVTFLQMWPPSGSPVPLHRSIVHGDLHSRNVLVEIKKGGFKQIWFIDFSHTGNGLSQARTDQARREGTLVDPDRGHTLRDFSRFEADVKFLLTRLYDENDLGRAVEFEKELLACGMEMRDLETSPLRGEALMDERFKKAWQVIRAIRQGAAAYLESPDDPRPYFFSLLHATLPVVYYRQEQFENEACELRQKRYAFISAGMLCRQL